MTVEFSYRPDNLRLKRTKGTIVNYLIWDGGQIVAELNGTGVLTDCYAYGLERIKSKGIRYFIHNGQGDVVHYANDNGKIMTSYSYDEYGNVTGGTTNNPFRYRGEYYDADLRLYYLRARWYDSALGEFISEDPVKDGVNWYVYCSNNPVKFRDPSGLVLVNAEEYAQTYDNADVRYEDNVIIISYGDQTLSVDQNANGRYYADDSEFVNSFGNGTRDIVVYNERRRASNGTVTTYVSIRVNVSFNDDAYNAATYGGANGVSYSDLIIDGMQSHWSDNQSLGNYQVSTYVNDVTGSTNQNNININFIDDFGISTARWAPGEIDIYRDYRSRDTGTTINRNLRSAQWSAAHELGHILGLPHTTDTSIMNRANTSIQANDIANILRANPTNRTRIHL